MSILDLSRDPHRRLNALTGEWILVSPGREKRPWQGKIEDVPVEARPGYDPKCYLCPGNARAGDRRNPHYAHTFVFDNDFRALGPDTPAAPSRSSGLLVAEGEPGICRVVCFSPRHDLTLAEMQEADIRRVVDVWAEETTSLGSLRGVNYVQIFENKGELMGCSNPHPHGQIWAERSIPVEPAKELSRAKRYRSSARKCLLCEYVRLESRTRERLVCDSDAFVAVVPFWAVWPYETLVISRRHAGSMPALDDDERGALAEIIRRITVRYDNLFRISFPYSAGFHQAPTDGRKHPEAHLHLHFYPPLLRSATVRKFMVGYEMLANPQRDITAEDAADQLRALSDIHYRRGETGHAPGPGRPTGGVVTVFESADRSLLAAAKLLLDEAGIAYIVKGETMKGNLPANSSRAASQLIGAAEIRVDSREGASATRLLSKVRRKQL